MRDQAERLRQIIENLKIEDDGKKEFNKTEGNSLSNTDYSARTRVISVTSGKGGVGKSNFTVNLGIILAQMGYRVVIFDADFGLSNIDVLLGYASKYSLANVIDNTKDITDIMIEGPYGIKLISGGSGLIELVNIDRGQLDYLISSLSKLESMADFLIIDTGAGINNSVVSFLLASSEVICITTPEPTSITDAYALIKTLSIKDKSKKISVVVNKADSFREAEEIMHKLTVVCSKFLNIKVNKLGYILRDDSVVKAVKIQQPFTLINSKSAASKNVSELAKRLLQDDYNQNDQLGMKSFISRLLNRN